MKSGAQNPQITINLWFNNNAKEAIDFYLSIFKDGKIRLIDYYTEVGQEITGHQAGEIVTIDFEILGTRFIAINAGPEFAFNPSVSLMIECENQAEIDYYWDRLSAVPAAEQCGWLQDKYGLSWQIVPKKLGEMMKNGNKAQRAGLTKAYLAMKKFDLKKLEAIFDQ